MVVAFEDIVKSIPKLTPEERAQLKSCISAVDSISSPAVPTSSNQNVGDIILNEICAFVEQRGLGVGMYSTLRKSDSFPKFNTKSKQLYNWMKGMKRDERISIMRIGIRLLYDNLRGMNLPVNAKMLMNQVHRIPEVLNQSFPGYSVAGMLSLIARQEGNDVWEE